MKELSGNFVKGKGWKYGLAFVAGYVITVMPLRIVLVYYPSVLFWCGILMEWLMSVRQRVLHRDIRKWLTAGVLALLFLFFIRTCRYEMQGEVRALGKWLWYAYYVPITGLPLITFCAAWCVGKEESRVLKDLRTNILFAGCWMVCILLAVGVLTNDLHGSFAVIIDHNGEEFTYHLNWLYYLVIGWYVLWMLYSFLLLLGKCRASDCRRRWYIPVLAICPGVFLGIWYLANGSSSPELFGMRLYKIQETYVVLFVGLWESFLRIGLIPANTGYEQIFAQSPLHADITDKDGHVVWNSAETDDFPAGKRDAQCGVPDQDHVLHTYPIRGGSVRWLEDISGINNANRKLADAIEYLKEEQALLSEENRVRTERASYEAQNRIYDSVSYIVRPQLDEALSLLADENIQEDDFQRRLSKSMLLCVYVKRRMNLALLAADSETLPVRELVFAIRETVEYLGCAGINAHVEAEGYDQNIPAEWLIFVYDFLEELIETAFPDLSALLINVRGEDPFGLMLTTDAPAGRVREGWRSGQMQRLGAEAEFRQDEDTLYARLFFAQ